jgi:hypothetical protein
VSPNVAWSGSLESYHPYLQVQKFPKFPKIECTHGGLPRTAKSHFGCLRTLVVKYQQCGKGKEKPSRTVVIQMATMHSKLGISLSNLVYV